MIYPWHLFSSCRSSGFLLKNVNMSSGPLLASSTSTMTVKSSERTWETTWTWSTVWGLKKLGEKSVINKKKLKMHELSEGTLGHMLLWVNSVPVVCWYKRTRTKQGQIWKCYMAKQNKCQLKSWKKRLWSVKLPPSFSSRLRKKSNCD